MNTTSIKHGETWKLLEYDYRVKAPWPHCYVYHNIETHETIRILCSEDGTDTVVMERYFERGAFQKTWYPALGGEHMTL